MSRNVNNVFKNGYYVPYYFKNLVNNFPVNSHDSCNYTAIAMLLSFYDTYWDDNIIPEQYEVKANLDSNSNLHNIYSLRVSFENSYIYNLTMDEYNIYIDTSYNPNFWNNGTMINEEGNEVSIKDNTNCYAYVLNTTNYGKIVPGTIINDSLDEYNILSYSQIYDKLYYDNLIRLVKIDAIEYNYYFVPVSKYQICPIGMYKVALVADISLPTRDFHLYRQDEDGFWSHKPGAYEVTCLDSSRNRILDPEECDRNYYVPEYPDRADYDIFVGYFAIVSLEIKEG